jgi:hypothetical protein
VFCKTTLCLIHLIHTIERLAAYLRQIQEDKQGNLGASGVGAMCPALRSYCSCSQRKANEHSLLRFAVPWPLIPSPAAYFLLPIMSMMQGCQEDTLDAERCASGYRWSADSLHIHDSHESLLSLTCHVTYWEPHNVAALKQVRRKVA